MTGSPWAFHAHPLSWVVGVAVGALYVSLLHRGGFAPTRRNALSLLGGILVLEVGLTWPVADLASHWSLLALVIQRLVFTLAVPPLLIRSVPHDALVAFTRPAPIDRLLQFCSRPPVAVVVVTVVAVGTLTTGAVNAQANNAALRGLFDVVLLLAGLVLWTPVLVQLPGANRPSVLGRAGYLIVQSIVPSFLSVVWIFSHHPLYAVFDHPHKVLGMTPLLDQQLAGFVAKLSTIAVLWAVAFVMLSRAQQDNSRGDDPDPLYWEDVERELERARRHDRRQGNAGGV